MKKIYTKIKTIEQFNNLKKINLKDEYEFFYSIFFKTKKIEIESLIKNKELGLFTIEDKKIIIASGNSKNCKYQKYTFLNFDDFIDLVKK